MHVNRFGSWSFAGLIPRKLPKLARHVFDCRRSIRAAVSCRRVACDGIAYSGALVPCLLGSHDNGTRFVHTFAVLLNPNAEIRVCCFCTGCPVEPAQSPTATVRYHATVSKFFAVTVSYAASRRLHTRDTCFAVHCAAPLPVEVGIFLSLSAQAIAQNDTTPAWLSSVMTGARLATLALACSAITARPAARAASDTTTPRLPPRRLPNNDKPTVNHFTKIVGAPECLFTNLKMYACPDTREQRNGGGHHAFRV
jgi:hypothetical protein